MAVCKPRLGITDKKQNTTQLAYFFKAADLSLDNIDTVIEIIRSTQPNFYNGYKSVRKIIETGTGSLAVKGFVTDTASGEPIKGVNLSFMPDGIGSKAAIAKASGNIVKKTADKGGFNIKTLPQGMYTVTISKNGYANQVETMLFRMAN